MTTLEAVPGAVPEADSAPWVEERIAEERRLFARTALVWLGVVPAVLAGAFLAWAGYWKAWPGAFLDGGLAVAGAALAGLGTFVERRLRGTALTLKGAGFALFPLAAALAVFFHGTLHPWAGLLFSVLASVAGVRLLGARAGLLALTLGAVAGASVLGALTWGFSRDDVQTAWILGTLAVVAGFGWRRDRTLPLGLLFAGFALGTGMADAWWGPASGGLCAAALAAGLLLLGRLEPLFQGFSWAGAGIAMALVLALPFPGPEDRTLAARLALGLLLSVGIAVAARGAIRPARWTALAAVTGLALFFILANKGDQMVLGWSGLAVVGGLIAFWGTRVTLHQARDEAGQWAAMPLAVATAAFAALAVALALGRAWQGVAAAILVPFLVDLRARFKAPILGSTACLLALSSGVWMFLGWPEELQASGGPQTLLWILYGLGTLLAATAAAAWIAARTPGAMGLASPMRWLAFTAAGLLSAVLTRQLYPGADTAWLVLAALVPLAAFPVIRRGAQWAARPRAALLLILLSMPAAPLSGTTFFATWPVEAPGALPGDFVRMELPPEILARFRGNYSDLHLRAAGREIYYQASPWESPERKLEIRVARPGRSRMHGISQIEISLPARGLTLSSIQLQTRADFFYRTVVLTDGSREIGRTDWACRRSPPGPCTLSWSLLPHYLLPRATRLSLWFIDGNDPPLGLVDVEIRWRAPLISFRWPEQGPVEILAGDLGPRENRWEALPPIPLRKARVETRDVGPGIARAGFGAAAVVLLALVAWSRSGRRRPSGGLVPILLVLAGLSATSVPAGAKGRLYTRPMDVPRAGWVRARLDPATLRHLGANGQGLRIMGPDGSRVQGSLESSNAPSEYPLSAEIPETPQKGRAVVRVSDPSEPAHDRLQLSTLGPAGRSMDLSPIPGVLVETSPDGKSWTTVGERHLFQVPRRGPVSSRSGLLSYPATRAPYLRVTLPGAPDAQFRSVAVFAAPSYGLVLPLERPSCRSGERVTMCRLSLPARGLQPIGVSFDVADRAPLGVRIYAAEEGSWKPLTEGVSRPAPDGVRHTVPLLGDKLKGRSLRVELQGADKAPRLVRASVELFQPAVAFHAEKPGRYLLLYGDGGAGLKEEVGWTWGRETLEIAPGPETAAPLPPLPTSAARPAVPPPGGSSAAWPVRFAGGKPGDVVRLEIPAEAYAYSRSDGDDLRLETEGQQIPYVRLIEDEPARAAVFQEIQPSRTTRGERMLRVPIPTGLPLTTVELMSTSKDPFEGWPSPSPSNWWQCSPRPLLPCHWTSELTQKDLPEAWWNPRQITGSTPAPADAVLWRRRDTLVFVWPGEGAVRLLSGSGAGAPTYDLDLLAPEILARPWRPAVLGPQEPEIGLAGLAGVAAGFGLLILLWRSLPGGPVARPRPKRG